MKIVFDPSFDRSVWRGIQENKKPATAGEVWTGTAGLLGILETQLGLGGPSYSDVERAAGLVPVLRSENGFWSRSFENDALSTAQTILKWRDFLCLQGWQGRSVASRLRQLAKVTRDVLPGTPDRLRSVLETLKLRSPDIDSIKRITPCDDLPGLWIEIFKVLEAKGTVVADFSPSGATVTLQKKNLYAARQPGFTPKSKDDSLQLLVASGPLEAAERVAAWLAGQDDLSGIVLVGGDSVLDAALHRHGLPTTGGASPTNDDTLLQVLPLVLAAGWMPPDPQRVLELLTLPRSPVPRGLAYGLDKALHECPAVGSGYWDEAMEKGLNSIPDAADRSRVAERMKVLFSPVVPHHKKYPATEISLRIATLLTWLQGRKVGEQQDTEPWDAAINQCTTLEHLIMRAQLKELSQPQLQRMVEDASSQTSGGATFPAEAGLQHVHSPEAIAGPVDRLIWWQFTDASVGGFAQLPLSRAEKAALAAVGVNLPEPALIAVARAERWRRPLTNTIRSLMLVCPEQGYDGGPQHPHPLWDEILANLSDPSRTDLAAALIRRELTPLSTRPRNQRRLFSLPQAQRVWNTAKPVSPREKESPSSAGTLLGCPLKWTLQYPGRIKGGSSAVLSEGNQLYGTLVHEIIAKLLAENPATAAVAERRAGQIFDNDGPDLATPLFLPGKEALKASVRRVTTLAAADLFDRLQKWGAKVVSSEAEYIGTGVGGKLAGTPDLVIDSPLRVIDFKWGGARYRRDLLADGGAYQLAVYGSLAGGKTKLLPGAYYILESRSLITAHPTAFPGAEVVPGPQLETILQGLEQAHAERRKELKSKQVIATALGEDEDSVPPKSDGLLENGSLGVAPPCNFCDYAGLCGQDFGEAQS